VPVGEGADTPKKVLTLIDASGFIFRAYHAIPHLSTSKGVPTNAAYGFTRMLLKAMRELKPTHLALAFDTASRQGRQEIDPLYKANRGEPPPDLLPQFPIIRRVIEALNVPVIDAPGWEADDVVGTLAKKAKAAGFCVQVVTGDKDFVQIVDEDVRLYDPMNDRHTGPAEVKERLGIVPAQMIDYLSLVGDAIDNVAKVPGIGPKTAVELLDQFGNVEQLLARLAEVKKPKIRQALEENRETLERAKRLVAFKTDLPLDFDEEKLAVRPIHEADARALFSELEFFKLLQEMPAQAPTPLSADTEVVDTRARLDEVAAQIRAAGRVALVPAFEGAPYDGLLVGLALALEGGRTFYVPLAHHTLGARNLGGDDFRGALLAVLEDAAIKKDGHDLKALTHLLARLGIALAGHEGDAELLSYLLNPSRREHALLDLSRERLRVELPAFPLGARKKSALPSELSEKEVAQVVGPHADASRRLALELWPDLERASLAKLARELELPLIPVLATMERHGVRVDLETLTRLSKHADQLCGEKLTEIHKLAGHEFNVGSPGQLAEVLFNELKLPIAKRGKTGPSTDQEVLEKLAELHPLPRAIIDYRGISKLKSTYLDALGPLLAKDARLHTTFHQAATATGRLSSTDPNLQNIPVRSELGREIRATFVAEEGNRLISADYSQIELRLLAHIAEDPALIEAFSRDEDVHTRTAAEVFGVAPDAVTADMRRAAKMVNFGIAYGLSPHGLSTRLGIPTEEAKSIIDRYFERYAAIRRYLDETIVKARQVGYVETLFGRRRFMGDLQSRNRAVAQAAERAAINMPIQGTAADLIKLAMLKVDTCFRESGLKARMLLQVHDELLFEAPVDEVERVKELARECMSSVAQLRVPLKVEVGEGRSWADAH
jgi:DNA polymerase-1